MTDELLPLIATLELRGRSSHIPEKAISVETQIRYTEDGEISAPAILLRELSIDLIEEGLRILRAVHNSTIPRGGVDKVIEWDR